MIPFFVVALSVYGLDLLTKSMVRARMALGAEIAVLPFFSLSHVNNTGIAFGLFQERNTFFLAVGALVAVAILIFGIRLYQSDRFSSLVLAGVVGAALGNLTDRIRQGHVTDFLDFYVGTYHWPVFNVADSVICVGAGLLLLKAARDKRRHHGDA